LQALSENAQLPEATGSEESPGAIDLPRFTEAIDLPRFAEAINKSDPQLSFRLAQPVPDLGFRQTLLATRSEAERLRQLADFLPAYLHRQRRIQHMKEVAPKNGHGSGGAGHMPGHPGSGPGPSGIE
jgi:hypothetical protein